MEIFCASRCRPSGLKITSRRNSSTSATRKLPSPRVRPSSALEVLIRFPTASRTRFPSWRTCSASPSSPGLHSSARMRARLETTSSRPAGLSAPAKRRRRFSRTVMDTQLLMQLTLRQEIAWQVSERSERAWWKTRLTLLFSILYFIFDGSGRIPDAVLRQRRHGCLH